MEIRSEFVIVNDRSIHVRVYNPDGEKTAICWHGLARNGFDFETLAKALARHYRVLCPDTLGRGLSQWARDPITEYNYPNYLAIAKGICEHFNVTQMDWIGTSMGGIIGILLASGPFKDKIQRLVINDIGPEIPADALARIIDYVSGEQPGFDTFFEYQDYLKELYGIWGQKSPDQWIRMTETSLRRNNQGQFTVHFDPDIIQKSDETVPVIDLWEPFSQVSCPILLFHGLLSDVLTLKIVKNMKRSQPDMRVITINDCGHAPGLHIPQHYEPILKFLS
ncbi:MAG: alpha/beta hydrolase [Desulfobacula sp.]|jgi:pimeloyl-ACP methyl ester carboxylesterase|nr:alpha/beta hydrolase [Desulfobacula sp.]